MKKRKNGLNKITRWWKYLSVFGMECFKLYVNLMVKMAFWLLIINDNVMVDWVIRYQTPDCTTLHFLSPRDINRQRDCAVRSFDWGSYLLPCWRIAYCDNPGTARCTGPVRWPSWNPRYSRYHWYPPSGCEVGCLNSGETTTNSNTEVSMQYPSKGNIIYH